MWQILPKPVLAEVGPNGHAPSKPRDVCTFGNHPAIFFLQFLALSFFLYQLQSDFASCKGYRHPIRIFSRLLGSDPRLSSQQLTEVSKNS